MARLWENTPLHRAGAVLIWDALSMPFRLVGWLVTTALRGALMAAGALVVLGLTVYALRGLAA